MTVLLEWFFVGLLWIKGLFCHKKIGSNYFALQSTILPPLSVALWLGVEPRCISGSTLICLNLVYHTLSHCLMLLGIIPLLFLQTLLLGFVILTVHVCRDKSLELSSIHLYSLLLCFQWYLFMIIIYKISILGLVDNLFCYKIIFLSWLCTTWPDSNIVHTITFKVNKSWENPSKD